MDEKKNRKRQGKKGENREGGEPELKNAIDA